MRIHCKWKRTFAAADYRASIQQPQADAPTQMRDRQLRPRCLHRASGRFRSEPAVRMTELWDGRAATTGRTETDSQRLRSTQFGQSNFYKPAIRSSWRAIRLLSQRERTEAANGNSYANRRSHNTSSTCCVERSTYPARCAMPSRRHNAGRSGRMTMRLSGNGVVASWGNSAAP